MYIKERFNRWTVGRYSESHIVNKIISDPGLSNRDSVQHTLP